MVTDVALPPALSAFCRLDPGISLGCDLIDAADDDKANEPGRKGPDDFEFRLHDPVAMLPADELFADGKLMPLQMAVAKPVALRSAAEIRSPERAKTLRMAEDCGSDPYALSPRAPSCTSRWRELLGLKRAATPKPDPVKVSPALAAAKSKNPNADARSLKHLFHRNPKLAPLEASHSLPLLHNTESDSVSISSRGLNHAVAEPGRSRIRRTASSEITTPPPPIGPVDSPRMNPSGKVVFHGLERSSSSPGSFTGGPRPRARGMERSYSATVVRVTPVLNVPVCSLRGSGRARPVFGFGQLFSPQKKEKPIRGLSATGSEKTMNQRD
ncbi:hypothetical protein MUK42_35326 [Musa troglodytarum]|uniref:Uncharacterized protein n=1 Tax=Musa troglodytarum TaxID=320322 RepID=A0A9E7HZW3_9LILI|nr:hypothetical protein MUK42_35326 [Musa troglodytarum]